jgi:ankyrin repeat protein
MTSRAKLIPFERSWRQIASIVLAAVLAFGTIAWGETSPGRALFEAVTSGNQAAVKRLVAVGAPVNFSDQAGRTPLLVAVEKNDIEIAALLIETGADINAQAANQDTPWLLAGALGRAQLLRKMIPKGPDLSLRNRYGGSALIPACERGHVEAVRVLLTTKIDLDLVNHLGWTCLLEIVILGNGSARHIEVAKLVLAAGANPNIADSRSVSLLTHARLNRQHEIAKLIEAAGGR